jgi:hypothetical protein
MAEELAQIDDAARLQPLTEREWPRPWMRPYLEALANIPNLSAAARAAGVARTYPYQVAKGDPDFAAAIREAKEIGVDLLERIALRRATQGEKRTIVRTREKRDETGKVVESETITEETLHVSDSLLTTLLKAHRPELYRERYDVRHTADDFGAPAVLDEIYRKPTRERMVGLARLAAELEPDVIEGVSHRRVDPQEEDAAA